MKRSLVVLAFLLVAAQPRPGTATSRPVAIVINGDTLALNPPPRFERNLLFVPVRRTVEALGLSFERTGNHITTQIGSKTVILTIGSRVAQVDAERLVLEAPLLEIHDVLYVTLRFFTDVLGAQAHFDRRSNTVTIVAQLVGRSSKGFLAVGSGFERFGTVAAVDVISDPPTVTLEDNGRIKTIPVAQNATIDVQDVNVNVTSPGELGDVRPGDFARVEMRKDGRVVRIVDEYGSHNGRILAIAGDEFVLGDGQVIAPGRTTEVSLNGKAASVSDLRPNDEVSVRYNVETNEVREILASRSVAIGPAGAAQSVVITAVETDANHPLRPGDTIHVNLHGTAGGSATFDIGSDVVDQVMVATIAGRLYRQLSDSAWRKLRGRRVDWAPHNRQRHGASACAADDFGLEHWAWRRRFRSGRRCDDQHEPPGSLCDLCGRCGSDQRIERACSGLTDATLPQSACEPASSSSTCHPTAILTARFT